MTYLFDGTHDNLLASLQGILGGDARLAEAGLGCGQIDEPTWCWQLYFQIFEH